jgi:hypothetical protein
MTANFLDDSFVCVFETTIWQAFLEDTCMAVTAAAQLWPSAFQSAPGFLTVLARRTQLEDTHSSYLPLIDWVEPNH